MKDNSIQFILNNELTEITFNDDLIPTETLLQFLRKRTSFKGTKEGCAEGDCGACTVVIYDNFDGEFRYKAVDSCLILLPMLHGRSVFTVEFLDEISDNNLHPVQTALIENNGTQCGYCTPGIVMSLFALYNNKSDFNLDTINDSLSGNLCRCTGYQTIKNACASIDLRKNFISLTNFENKQIEFLRNIEKIKPIFIKSKNQEYYKCFKKEDILKYIDINNDSIIINGSTDVSLAITKKHETLNRIVDISSAFELKKIIKTENWIKIGSGASLELIKSFCKNELPIIYEVLSVFASKQIRELGTIGGNIGSSSPISDLLPILMVLEAEIKLQSLKTDRLININNYVLSYRKTERKNNELITKIHIPIPKKNVIHKFYKISKRKDMDISTLSACFELKLNGIIVENIKIAFGGMDSVAKRVHQLENFIIGKVWEKKTIEEATDIIAKTFNPISDARSSAEFRIISAKNLLIKFWSENQ